MSRKPLTLNDVREYLKTQPGRVLKRELGEHFGTDAQNLADKVFDWQGDVTGVRALRSTSGTVIGFRYERDPWPEYAGPGVEWYEAQIEALTARLAEHGEVWHRPVTQHARRVQAQPATLLEQLDAEPAPPPPDAP